MRKILLCLVASFLFCTSCTLDEDDKLRAQIQRITNEPNRHQAFTDLVFFDNQFFLTFRESDKHAHGAPGVIKLLSSPDGENWNLIKEYALSGIDLRDPKFAVNGDELMLYIHGVKFQGETVVALYDYHFKYSNNWSIIKNVSLDNNQQTIAKNEGNEAWPWRVTWYNGNAYSIGYNGVDIFGIYKSTDGLLFKNEKSFNAITNEPTEATIRVNDKGEFYFFARRNNGTALFGKYDGINRELNVVGEIPYVNFGGPNFLFLNEKQILFTGAHGKVLVGLYDLENKRSKILLKLAGGDCGYPGMVIKDGFLWMSYYTSYQAINGSSIYIAKIDLKNLSQ